jgi:hypothetical protein
MGKVVATKPNNVTEGVIDKTVQTHENMKSVTFADVFGTLHTVFAHTEGPFKTPEDVVRAFENGTLHVFDSHEAAIEHWSDRAGNEVIVAALRDLEPTAHDDAQESGNDR